MDYIGKTLTLGNEERVVVLDQVSLNERVYLLTVREDVLLRDDLEPNGDYIRTFRLLDSGDVFEVTDDLEAFQALSLYDPDAVELSVDRDDIDYA